MSRAESLYRLQLLDLDLDQTRKRQREIEAAVADNPAVNHARAELAKAHKDVIDAQLRLKSLELDALALEERIRSGEDRLYGGKITNPKELIDTERDLAHHKKHKVEAEDKELNAMLALDDARDTERRCSAALKDAVERWESDNAVLLQELTRVKDRLVADGERRAAALSGIPRADLDLYAALRAKKNGLAVATIRGGACGVCGEQPSSQQLQQARVGSEIVTCTTCGRILYGA